MQFAIRTPRVKRRQASIKYLLDFSYQKLSSFARCIRLSCTHPAALSSLQFTELQSALLLIFMTTFQKMWKVFCLLFIADVASSKLLLQNPAYRGSRLFRQYWALFDILMPFYTVICNGPLHSCCS